MNPYAPLLIMTVLALLVAVGSLVMGAIISPAQRSRVKVVSYEYGIGPTLINTEYGRSLVSFYLTGMIFIIFGIEVAFLYPWAMAFGRLGFFGLGAAILFIGLITMPYILE